MGGSVGEARRVALVAFLRINVSAMLSFRPDRIEITEALNMLALDSLMAIELRSRVNTQLHIDIPVVTFMEGKSVLDLADEINHLMPTDATASNLKSETQRCQSATDIDAMN